MKVLVTGGAGFIGSNFIHYMLNKYQDYKIINLDALTYAGNLENLKTIENHPNYLFIKGSIADCQLVDTLVRQGVDYIINFAAESHVDRSIENPATFVKTNIVGTHVLLDVSVKYPVKKYLQVSTDEVYGSLEKGLFTEESPLAPNNPYAASKASADLLVRAYHKTYNLPVNITRASNNYGPCQFPEKLIPLMIIRAIEGKELPVYGDGMQIRDWLHVKDHCRAIDQVLHHGVSGEVYNIGANNERSNLEVVNLIIAKLGKSQKRIKHVKDRPAHDKRYAVDAAKIRRELGWEPIYDFEKGMEETIQWYLTQYDRGRFSMSHFSKENIYKQK